MGSDHPRRKRVAIVDDCPDVRFLLATVIELDHRFEVVAEADDASSGLAAVVATSPDLVLVDLRLGTDDGASLIGELRRSGVTACLVVITGSTDANDHAAAFNAGADGLQTKAAMTSTMVDQLADLVARHRPDRAVPQAPSTTRPRAVYTLPRRFGPAPELVALSPASVAS
jgi:DNA-binding NarL/FixJ family response regulator